MIRNLINEADYSLIKKTHNYYSIFQTIVFIFFIIITIKLFLIVSKSSESVTLKTKEIVYPTLFDANNNVLAQTLITHKIQVSNFDNLNNNYKNILIKDINILSPKIAKQINDLTSNFFFIDRSPSKKKILETLYLGNPEIKLDKFYKRNYPFNAYTKNLIGKMDIDNVGQSLIEKQMNSFDQSLKLSINIDLQKEASDVLDKELIKYDANYGMFILVDLLKEELLVNTYNANRNYLDLKFDDSVMPSISNRYEFGSVFKPITVYSALNNNVLNLDEYFDVTEPLKRYTGNGYIMDLFPINEKIQTKDILKRSSNIGAALINRKIDCSLQFKKDLFNLGLLNSVSIMENIKTIEPSQPLHYTRKGNYCDNLAFGYALSVSPINLINAYSRMITGKEDFEVNITKQRNFKDLNLDSVSSNINRLLFYANESDHMLYRSCLVAGKTGTADDKSIIKDNEDMSPKVYNNVTFMSYFPYNKPRYLALTFMNHPKKTKFKYLTAGNTVKNSFYNIMDQILFSLEISSCDKDLSTI